MFAACLISASKTGIIAGKEVEIDFAEVDDAFLDEIIPLAALAFISLFAGRWADPAFAIRDEFEQA